MTQTVVVAAGRPAVVLDGGPARRVRLHVVDLAVLGATVAERMEALPVAHLDGAGDGAGEEAPAHPDCTRSGPSSTTRSTHARSSRRTRLSEGDRLHPRARQGEQPVECSVDAHVRCLLVRLSWQIPNLKGVTPRARLSFEPGRPPATALSSHDASSVVPLDPRHPEERDRRSMSRHATRAWIGGVVAGHDVRARMRRNSRATIAEIRLCRLRNLNPWRARPT